MARNNRFKSIEVKYKFCSSFKKVGSLIVMGLLILSYSCLSGQIRAIHAIPLNERHLHNEQHPIVLENDRNGIFYLENVSGDTLILKRQSETSSQKIVAVLKGFDLNNGLKHCIVKKNERIFLLNRYNNSIQYYDCIEKGNLVECTKISEYKVELANKEKLIRIEKDNRNVYLVSYNFKRRCQNFHLLNTENNTVKLLYTNYNPFIEIFYSDDNVSNYSFFNNKLALVDFYSGHTLIVNLMNSHVDSVKLPFILGEKHPSHGTFERLNNKYDKHPTWANYDSLMNLVYTFNHVINSFFMNDSTILITVFFKDFNLAPFDLICVDLSNQRTIFKQRRIDTKSASETVKLSNMPIYIGYEEANYIGDGVIYVYKELPELNKYNLREFLNTIEQQDGPKIGTFIMYK